MTVTATVSDSNGIQAQFETLVGSSGVARLKAANQKNADEFMGLVKLAVPRDPKAQHEHLVETVQKSDVGEVGAQVQIGSDETPYPAHLEFGHRSRGGTHVPAKPAWYPAKRVVWKRAKDRLLRAQRAAIKAAAVVSSV